MGSPFALGLTGGGCGSTRGILGVGRGTPGAVRRDLDGSFVRRAVGRLAGTALSRDRRLDGPAGHRASVAGSLRRLGRRLAGGDRTSSQRIARPGLKLPARASLGAFARVEAAAPGRFRLGGRYGAFRWSVGSWWLAIPSGRPLLG